MPNALKLLHSDHEKVSDNFKKAIGSDDLKKKMKIFDDIAEDLEIHTTIEEEILYPAVREATGRDSLVDDALREHRQIKDYISRLRLLEPGDGDFNALLTEFHSATEAHIAEEESKMFPAAEAAMEDKLDAVGNALMKRKMQLRAAPPVAKAIDIDLPAHSVYEQWMHVEEFPRFMEGVHEVRRTDATHMHWRAEVAGKEEEWDSEIDEDRVDERVTWHSITGVPQSGRVSFRPVAPEKTRMLLEMVYKPKGFMESIGAMLGAVSRRVEGDLERFKKVAESRQRPGM